MTISGGLPRRIPHRVSWRPAAANPASGELAAQPTTAPAVTDTRSEPGTTYLDCNATAPLLPACAAAMAEVAAQARGNPSSLHALGRQSRARIDEARQEVAELVGAKAEDVTFTSGGTEANVWALQAAFADRSGAAAGLAVTAVEHSSILETARELARQGVSLQVLPVDARGALLPIALARGTRLLAAMAANNETGTLFDVAGLAAVAHAAGARLHCDAVQALGKIVVDTGAWDADSGSVSAHKIGGPQGIGALVTRPGLTLSPLLRGGGQERGRRSGTENVMAIVGFGAAARETQRQWATAAVRARDLRDRLEARLLAALPGCAVQGDRERRLPNTSSLAFPGVKGEALVVHLDALGICVSTGSACSSGSSKPSHVLVAMGVTPAELGGALRVSLGPATTEAEIEMAGDAIVIAVRRLRALAA